MSEEDKPKRKIIHRPVWLVSSIIGFIILLVLIVYLGVDYLGEVGTEPEETLRNIRGVLWLFFPVAWIMAFVPKSNKKK